MNIGSKRKVKKAAFVQMLLAFVLCFALLSSNAQITAMAFKDELKAAIEYTQNLVEDEYKPKTWTVFEGILKAVIEIYDNPGATYNQVNDATAELYAAINALEKLADKEELIEVIDEALELDEEDFTPISWEILTEILDDDELNELIDDLDASQEEVDDAYEALREAIDALVLRAYKRLMLITIDEADMLVLFKSDYTPGSWANIAGPLEYARSLIEDHNVSQETVNAATQVLRNAIDALVRVAATPSATPSPVIITRTVTVTLPPTYDDDDYETVVVDDPVTPLAPVPVDAEDEDAQDEPDVEVQPPDIVDVEDSEIPLAAAAPPANRSQISWFWLIVAVSLLTIIMFVLIMRNRKIKDEQ